MVWNILLWHVALWVETRRVVCVSEWVEKEAKRSLIISYVSGTGVRSVMARVCDNP